ncbi:hypothetical protein P171DRAFT_182393 [Karstenula rhodostoma CBS 690.94]|uniref:Uncharacterized protein n=1 Tax=Karstenula rhodostoma CBS 690.94 TaxID=1392251 RepID=A0A9P4P4W6_9PLEO|nr:hypothetical protein P171DRAFT_182393 [Karstenula rhodostoma CBS 690.94]
MTGADAEADRLSDVCWRGMRSVDGGGCSKRANRQKSGSKEQRAASNEQRDRSERASGGRDTAGSYGARDGGRPFWEFTQARGGAAATVASPSRARWQGAGADSVLRAGYQESSHCAAWALAVLGGAPRARSSSSNTTPKQRWPRRLYTTTMDQAARRRRNGTWLQQARPACCGGEQWQPGRRTALDGWI